LVEIRRFLYPTYIWRPGSGVTSEVLSSAFALENSAAYAIMHRWWLDDRFSRFSTMSASVKHTDG